MKNFVEKPDNFEKQQDMEVEFDGEHITINGNSEEIKKTVEEIMEMNEWNIKNALKGALNSINNKSDFPFNADILTSDGKMVRILIDVMPNNVVITLGGGGNSISSEEMRKEISCKI